MGSCGVPDVKYKIGPMMKFIYAHGDRTYDVLIFQGNDGLVANMPTHD